MIRPLVAEQNEATHRSKSFVAELFRSKAMTKTYFNYLEAMSLSNLIYVRN